MRAVEVLRAAMVRDGRAAARMVQTRVGTDDNLVLTDGQYCSIC